MGRYVQYGAGLCGPEGWLNFDASPRLRMQRLPLIGGLFRSFGPRFPKTIHFGDIIHGLPLQEAYCDAIYCSHVLEHLSLSDFRIALRNTYSHLKPGGRFRLVVPDLEHLARAYLSSTDPEASIAFMKGSFLGHPDRPRGLAGLLSAWLGNSAHLWMWDEKALEKELAQAGFTGIRRARYGDSGDPAFAAVETPVRWENCLGMDCFRPRETPAALQTKTVAS